MNFRHPNIQPRRERSRNIARLNVLKAEWADMKAILTAHSPCEIIDGKRLPVVPGWFIEVLCSDPDTALAVMVAWNDYVQTSPHR